MPACKRGRIGSHPRSLSILAVGRERGRFGIKDVG